MKSEGGDTFVVAFQGRLVECFSLEDAIAIKTAGDILADFTTPDASAAELSRLSVTLQRYDLADAAHQLAHHAARIRAREFLTKR
jgi:hypothetical protein